MENNPSTGSEASGKDKADETPSAGGSKFEPEQTKLNEEKNNYPENKGDSNDNVNDNSNPSSSDSNKGEGKEVDYKKLYEQSQNKIKKQDETIKQWKPKIAQVDDLVKERNESKITAAINAIPSEVLSDKQKEDEKAELLKDVNEGNQSLEQVLKYTNKLASFTKPLAKKAKVIQNSKKDYTMIH